MKQTPPAWSEFSEGPGGGWDVCLNTTDLQHIHLLQGYARAYHKAAQLVFEDFRQKVQAEEWPQQMAAHPMVFLYRQALEIYLKTVIARGESLQHLHGRPLAPREQTFTDHNLTKLLPGLKEVFGLIDCSGIWSPPTFRSFADIERIVRAVDEFPHDAFRYPVGRAASRDLLPCGVRFSVLVFAEKLDGLLDLLEAASTRTWDTFQTETTPPTPY